MDASLFHDAAAVKHTTRTLSGPPSTRAAIAGVFHENRADRVCFVNPNGKSFLPILDPKSPIPSVPCLTESQSFRGHTHTRPPNSVLQGGWLHASVLSTRVRVVLVSSPLGSPYGVDHRAAPPEGPRTDAHVGPLRIAVPRIRLHDDS